MVGHFGTTSVSQKRPTFDLLYNLDIQGPVTIIFGRNVTKKVTNQTMPCFPTSLIQWFCTTLRNRKPRNCVFSLKNCMLFCHRTHKTHSNYHLVAVELPFIPKVINYSLYASDNILQPIQKGSIASCCLLSTRFMFTKSVTVSVAVQALKDGTCSSSSLE